jgi:hypothetical protein
MQEATSFFNLSTDLLLPAIVSTIVTVAVSFLLKWAEVWRSADVSYRFEQGGSRKVPWSIARYCGEDGWTPRKSIGKLRQRMVGSWTSK